MSGDGYDTSESYFVLGMIGLILALPFIVVAVFLLGPMVMTYLYYTGLWTP